MSEEHQPKQLHLPVNPHLAQLLAEGASDALPLRGYIGPATDEEHIALYTNINDLSTSIEVARSDILHSAEAPKSLLPNDGGVILWVRKNAKITHRHTESVEVHKGRLRIRFRARSMMRRRFPETQGLCGWLPACGYGCVAQCFRPPPCGLSCNACKVCQSTCNVCQSVCQTG